MTNFVLEVYLAALKLCEEYASAKYALRVIKDFIIDYKGIPYHRGLFIDFFTVFFLTFCYCTHLIHFISACIMNCVFSLITETFRL